MEEQTKLMESMEFVEATMDQDVLEKLMEIPETPLTEKRKRGCPPGSG